MKVSLLTLTYNGLNVLKPCVESVLKNCSNVDFQWIIRENNSSDGSLDYLKTVDPTQDMKIIVANNDGNFAQMNNEVIEDCDGEYLLFLNNDITCTNDFITPMVKVLDNDPEVGSVGAILRYPDGQFQHTGIVFNDYPAAHNLSWYFAQQHGIDLNVMTSKDRIYQLATGACLLVRKSEFLELGKFDERFHWCYDDVDLGMALKTKLNKICVVPKDVQLTHHESWSKAKPANLEALALLQDKYKGLIEPDHYFYKFGNYNEYQK